MASAELVPKILTMANVICNTNSILNRYVAQLRDEKIQSDPMRFRRNLERIGEVMGYELSKTLDYEPRSIVTPLGTAQVNLPSEKIVLATILRAGLPLHQGLLNAFDHAESAFVSAYRKHRKGEEGFDISVEYQSSPLLEGKVLIVSDPMLATGRSMVLVLKELLHMGAPKAVHIVSVIASKEGVEHLKKHVPVNTKIWVAAVDEEMTAQAYIVPGLGDAGDLAYGAKV